MDKKLYELFLMMGYFDTANDDGGGIADIDLNEDDKDEDDDKDNDDKDDKDDKDDNKDDDKDDDVDEDKDNDDKNNDEDDDEDDDEDKDDDEDTEDEDDNAVGEIKAIKAKYSTFFKEFPGVKAALYRDQQYSEHFGSPKDAEAVVNKANVLDKVEEDLFINHDPSELLKSLAKDKGALEGVAFEFMRWTQANDRDLYLEICALPLKQVLRSAWKEGNGEKTNLGRAAAYIHKHFFNDTDISGKVKIEDGKSTKSGEDPAKKAYEERLSRLDEREYNNFKGAVDQSYVRKMTSHVQESLDRDERLNDWMKGRIVKEVLEEIRVKLNGDSRYMNHIGSLWKQAKTAGFDNDFKSRIVNTALARAKSLVPEIRKRLVSDALGKKMKKDEKDNNVRKFKKVDHSDSTKPNKNKQTNKSDIDILREA